MVLPEAHVVYGTYGHLNAAHDNVIFAAVALHGKAEWVRVVDGAGQGT